MMVDRLLLRGGAFAMGVRATWPLATLRVDRDKIDLKITLLGHFSFSANQVVSLERYGSIPFLGYALRIRHNVQSYPGDIRFLCTCNPDELIRKITELGFRPSASSESAKRRSGIPVRWQVIAIIVVIWNLFFLLDWLYPARGYVLGWPALLPLVFIFLTALVVSRSSLVQFWVVNSGHSVSEIRPLLNFIMLVTGLIMSAFLYVILFKCIP